MLGDHSVSLWWFKWPTERLYKQDGNCPANISVINAHCALHTVGAAKRNVPLLGMRGWAICWPPTATWGAGTETSRGAGSTRTACTTSGTAAGLCQNELCDLRETQCSYESCDVQWRIWWVCDLWVDNLADRYGRQPVAAHHHHVVITVPQQPFLSKISRGLCRKTPLSHDRNRAVLCMDTQAVSKHQQGERFRKLFPKELKIVKAEIEAATFINDKKL